MPLFRATLEALASNAANLHIKAFSSDGSASKICRHHGITGTVFAARASRGLRVIFIRTRQRTIQLLDFVHRSDKFYYSYER